MAELRRGMSWVPERLRDSQGFALAMAVFALVLLAAVVAGGYFAASQEFQIGRGMRSLTASFYAGEAGILQVLDDWDPKVYNGMAPTDTVTVGPYTFVGGGNFTATIVRVSATEDSLKRYFYIETVGRPAAPSVGERRQAVVVRAHFPNLCCDGAVRAVRNVVFSGGAQPIISGFNNDPPGIWPASACAGIAGDSTAGVIRSPAGSVNDPSRVEGLPAIVSDATLSAATVFDFGDYDYNDLVALADHEFIGDTTLYNTTASVVNGECDTSDPLNLGAPTDPSSPCFDYFPIIHVTGHLSVTGTGVGQGILLVDRDLQITGPFEFYGIALVSDDLLMGGPVDYYGVVHVADDVWFSGATPRFFLSQCAAQRAQRLSSLAYPRLISPRAWVELF